VAAAYWRGSKAHPHATAPAHERMRLPHDVCACRPVASPVPSRSQQAGVRARHACDPCAAVHGTHARAPRPQVLTNALDVVSPLPVMCASAGAGGGAAPGASLGARPPSAAAGAAMQRPRSWLPGEERDMLGVVHVHGSGAADETAGQYAATPSGGRPCRRPSRVSQLLDRAGPAAAVYQLASRFNHSCRANCMCACPRAPEQTASLSSHACSTSARALTGSNNVFAQ
jgi:hypothetical protein